MFFFNKKNPFLKDLIPSNHVDIHSHLLPGIDDGAKTFEDTVFLITELQKIGHEQLITTPHVTASVWENTRDGIENTLRNTKEDLVANGMNVPLKAAAEYMIDGNFETLFKSEPLLTLKDNYILVELSYINAPLQLYDFIFDLQLAGYIPVLAHPERYGFYHRNFDEYKKLKNAGCLFQVNLLSTVAYYGSAVAEAADKLLQSGMVNFVGSDVHHKNHITAFNKRLVIKDTKPLEKAISNNQLFRF